MSHPWPEKWLDDCIAQYEASAFEEMEESEWMQEMICQLKTAAKDGLSLTQTSLELFNLFFFLIGYGFIDRLWGGIPQAGSRI